MGDGRWEMRDGRWEMRLFFIAKLEAIIPEIPCAKPLAIYPEIPCRETQSYLLLENQMSHASHASYTSHTSHTSHPLTPSSSRSALHQAYFKAPSSSRSAPSSLLESYFERLAQDLAPREGQRPRCPYGGESGSGDAAPPGGLCAELRA